MLGEERCSSMCDVGKPATWLGGFLMQSRTKEEAHQIIPQCHINIVAFCLSKIFPGALHYFPSLLSNYEKEQLPARSLNKSAFFFLLVYQQSQMHIIA